MLVCFARAAILVLALLAGIGAANTSALAGDLADFNAAVESASAHNRVAIGYLRTGNPDLASLEIDRLREAWGELAQRFAGKRPDAFDGNPLYGTIWTGVSARLVAADLMLKTGRPEAAANRSTPSAAISTTCARPAASWCWPTACATPMPSWTRSWSTTTARSTGPNRKRASASPTRRRSTATCSSAATAIAGEAVRKAPEFRRLVDGAKAGLALIPKAIATRDGDLLHRVLIELRSFDNLLAFRFGYKR